MINSHLSIVFVAGERMTLELVSGHALKHVLSRMSLELVSRHALKRVLSIMSLELVPRNTLKHVLPRNFKALHYTNKR